MVSPKVITITPNRNLITPKVIFVTLGILFLNDNSLNQGLQFYPNILTFLLQTTIYRAIGHVRENRFWVTWPKRPVHRHLRGVTLGC